MAFNREFIVDQILVHEQLDDMQNAIASIKARWKITHSDYPNGVAYHVFHKIYLEGEFDLDNFIPIEDVTNAVMEQWLTANISPEAINEIYNAAFPQIKTTDATFGLTTYYENPDMFPGT